MSLTKKSASHRAVFNTLVIYAQRFFAAALSLITTPIILNGLGIENYGIYTLTIGFVGMLSFLNWSLSSSTQRYIAFAIGENNVNKIKSIFSTSLLIHLVYASIFLLIITTIAQFFVNQLLNIPIGKENEAKLVLTMVGGITFLNIINIPFLGVLRAYENFLAISLVGVTESVLKLGIAAIILFTTNNQLIIYSALLLTITIITTAIYIIIVKQKHKDVKVTFLLYQKKFANEMLSFISWSLLGAISIMSRNQGVQVILNLFFGVVKNAAYGISTQISVAMSILAQGIIGSISPQIIKSAGARDYEKMIFLMRTMSKFAIYSISIIAIPVFFECELILTLWLKIVPENTVTYIRLTIIFGQIMLLSAGIQTVFDALGKVKQYNIYISIILMLNLPIAYLFFHFDFQSYTIIIIGMILEFISLNVRLYLLKKYLNFSISKFYYDTVFNVLLPTLITSAIIWAFTLLNINHIILLLLVFVLTIIIYPSIIYNFSLEQKQKELLKGILKKNKK